jgi:hypothetical protein
VNVHETLSRIERGEGNIGYNQSETDRQSPVVDVDAGH